MNILKIVLKYAFFILLIVLTGVLLYWRYKYGLQRFFDIDEFAHMHWAYNAFIGEKPFIDFFYFFPPAYIFTLIPVFIFGGRSVEALMLARSLSFGVFALSLLVVFLFVRKVRNAKTAFLSVLILAFLPIPLDKWIEIRPDGLGVLLSLSGMLFLIYAFKDRKSWQFFASGVLYALSVAVVPKVALSFLLALFLVFLDAFSSYRKGENRKISKFFKNSRGFSVFFLASIIPVVFVFILLAFYGQPVRAVELISLISANASKVLGGKFPIPTNFFFYPNDIFYGAWGYSKPYIANLIIWILGIVWGIVLLMSSWSRKEKHERYSQFLIALTFYVNLIAFLWLSPLKHAQYLVPLSPFIAYFASDLFMEIFYGLRRRVPKIGYAVAGIFLLVLVGGIFASGEEMYRYKLLWGNEGTLTFYSHVYDLIPEDEAVFDLSGETIFYKSGFYFCCIPYGQYEEALTFEYPDMKTELTKRNVHFVHLQEEGRLGVLPKAHEQVIRQYYTIYPDGNKPYLLVSGALLPFFKGNTVQNFELISSGDYLILWNHKPLVPGAEGEFLLDGTMIKENPVYLEAGNHTLQAPAVGEARLRYTWKGDPSR